MILQAISNNLRQQNWFSVVVEIFVVVAGILIGLQIDSWNSERLERSLEHKYLVRLLTDMEESVSNQKVEIDLGISILKDMDYLALHLREGTTSEADQGRLANAIDSSGVIPTVRTNLTTINELQSTGNMMLIRDQALRQAIGELMASHSTTQLISKQSQDAHISTAVRTADWVFYGPPEEGSIGGGARIEAQFRYTTAVNWDRIIADDGAANLISLMGAWSRYNLGHQAAHQRVIVKLRDLLQQKAISAPERLVGLATC